MDDKGCREGRCLTGSEICKTVNRGYHDDRGIQVNDA